MEDRLIELEMRVAHYEEAQEALSEVIARQQNEIAELERSMAAVLDFIRHGRSSDGMPEGKND